MFKYYRILFCFIFAFSSALQARLGDEIEECVVIGAGLSGLTLAHRIRQSGKDVQIYEARERLGGRAYTIEMNGTSVDLGGEFVEEDHAAIWDLIKKFGLETKGHALNHPIIALRNGKQIPLGTLNDTMQSLLDKLHAFEMKMTTEDTGLFKELDLTEEERALLNLMIRDEEGIEGNLASAFSAPLWRENIGEYIQVVSGQREDLIPEGHYSQSRIVGGTKALVDALAASIGSERIHTRKVLRQVSWDQGERIFHLNFGDGLAVKARSVVMTAPFSVLRGDQILDDASLGIDPDLRRFIDGMTYGTNSKIIYPTTSPVNLLYGLECDGGFGAWAKGDKVLTIISGGEVGARVSEADVESGLGQNFMPLLNVTLAGDQQPVVKNWSKDPFSLGSYRSFPAGEMSEFDDKSPSHEHLRVFATTLFDKGIPLFFAGEHTDFGQTGYMNSAVRSALAIYELLQGQK